MTMLPKKLLEVRKRKPNIAPRYRDIDEYRPAAKQVIAAYEPGTTRGEIEDAVADLETHETFKLVRGLSTLLDRRAEFEHQSPIPPPRLRAAVFERGFVTTETEREAVLAQVASEHGLTTAAVEDGLWADRDEAAVLVAPPDIGPDALLREYNLSVTQTLLFDAVELSFTASGNYQSIFRALKYRGLMYAVDEDLTVTVTGPAAVLKRTRKYGTTLATVLPSIMAAQEWTVTAQIETEVSGESRIYEFSLDDSQTDLFPDRTPDESYDSEVERDFATRIASLADGWTVTREPTILRTGTRVMIPDFSFERDRTGETALYLEVIGFWTPEYLEEKLAKVRTVEADRPIMLAVNETLNCTEADFDDANVEHVFFYADRIPVKPVLSRLNAIDERHIERDLQTLTPGECAVPQDEVTPIGDLADAHGVEPGAIRRHLAENDAYTGMISNDRYVPESVLESIASAVDTIESPTLADVNPILNRYDVAQNVLETLGYTVQYTSLNQAEASVRKDTDT